MAIPAILGAVAPIIGSVLGGIFGYKGQSGANAANLQIAREQMGFQRSENMWAMSQTDRMAKEAMAFEQSSAREQMEFQRTMSNTAHQREIADLRAAGLNPVLSGTGGAGAAVGSGASASGSMGSASGASGASAHMESALGRGLASALQVRELSENLKNMKASREVMQAETRKKLYEAKTAEIDAEIRGNDAVLSDELVRYAADFAKNEYNQSVNATDVSSAAAAGARLERKIDEGKAGEFVRYLNRFFGAGSSAKGVLEVGKAIGRGSAGAWRK